MESQTTTNQSSSLQTNYPFGLDNSTELARAAYQDRFLTRRMGGTFSEREGLPGVSHLLDVGCGPGGWLLEVAHDYPKVEAVGIDLSEMMIEYASSCARCQGMDNARFMVMDALKPLEFDDESFEFVNVRYASLFVSKAQWPDLIRECCRITAPHGIIRLTEWERPITSSLAVEKLYTLLTQAQKQRGISLSPDGQHVGILPFLGQLLRDAGCQEINSKLYELDFSASSEDHETGYLHFLVAFQMLQPFLIQMHCTTQEEFTELYQQALLDIMSKDYCSLAFVRTVWGEKSR